MSLNKYSSPEEVKNTFRTLGAREAMKAHINRHFPEFNPFGLSTIQLEKAIRTLSTKAMETL